MLNKGLLSLKVHFTHDDHHPASEPLEEQLTGVSIGCEQFAHVGSDLCVLEDGDGVGLGGEVWTIVVEILHGDVNVDLAVSPSPVDGANFKCVLVLFLSIQGLQNFELS